MSSSRDETTGTSRFASSSTADFPDEAFETLAAVEASHFWFQSRNRLIVWALGHYFPEASRLLEVGCGTGVVLGAIRGGFPAMQLVGSDTSGEALRIAGNRVHDADFVELDARHMPFRDEFDVVCAFDVLEHIDEDVRVLGQLAAATRRGGGLLVTVPQYRWLWSAADDYGRHKRRYTKREINRKVESAGLSVMRSTSWVCTLLPLVAMSRFRDRRAGDRYDPSRELRIAGPVNHMFELILDAERVAIEKGLTLPFGASRLVVAQKL
jgi:SAM-dependent methyltransferase